MSDNDESVTYDNGPGDEGLDVAQWLAILVIVTGLALTVAGSLELVAFDDGTLRLLLGAGIILTAGVEGARAIAKWFAS